MKKKYSFRVLTFSSGKKLLIAHVSNKPYSLLESFSSFFHNIQELRWIRDEINKELLKEGQSYTGQNTLKIGVTKNEIELSQNYDPQNIQIIPTELVINFIDDAIEFYELYELGGIPGIIPESKNDEWVIVPKEFVKEEYWKKSDSG